jgi:hypothetical protein
MAFGPPAKYEESMKLSLANCKQPGKSTVGFDASLPRQMRDYAGETRLTVSHCRQEFILGSATEPDLGIPMRSAWDTAIPSLVKTCCLF